MENSLTNQNANLKQSKIGEVISQTRTNFDTNQNVTDHLKRLFVLLGIGEGKIPSKEESTYFVQMYKAAFSLYSLAEIEYAFQLAIKGTIKFDFTLYDNKFSVVFVSGLMNKYREWRKQNTDYQKHKIPVTVEKTPEEIFAYMKERAINSFNEYKAGNPEFVKFHIYNWLDKNDFINVTTARKNDFYAEAKNELFHEMEVEKGLAANPNDFQKVINKYSGNTKQVNRAKELALKDFFDGLIEMEIDIKEKVE